MKIKAVFTTKFGKECLAFDDFMIIKESDNFYGVYLKYRYPTLITSGETMKDASKKAKLLQIGFNEARYEFGY